MRGLLGGQLGLESRGVGVGREGGEEEAEETEKGSGGKLWDWNLAGRWDGTPASWVKQGCCWEKRGEG